MTGISSSYLYKADLRPANLEDADLTDVYSAKADLADANLRGVHLAVSFPKDVLFFNTTIPVVLDDMCLGNA